MKNLTKILMLAVASLSLAGCDKNEDNGPVTSNDLEYLVAAGDSAAIAPKLETFRNAAGTPVNTTPGAVKGRREINWDGVPANLTNNDAFPADFFNPVDTTVAAGRKRGLIYFPANAALRVSDKNFSDIDPAFASQFQAFSRPKTFSPAGSNMSELRFKVPGNSKDAYVSYFGVIFSDVDNAQSTVVEAYDGDRLIGKINAPVADKKFSFVGIHAVKSKITRVKITSGNVALKAGITDSAAQDLVVYDDLIYDEPKGY